MFYLVGYGHSRCSAVAVDFYGCAGGRSAQALRNYAIEPVVMIAYGPADNIPELVRRRNATDGITLLKRAADRSQP